MCFRKGLKTFLAEEGFHLEWLKRSLPPTILNSLIGDIRPDLAFVDQTASRRFGI